MPRKKSRKKEADEVDFGKLFEIILGTVMAFAAIAVVFAIMYFTFGFVKGGLNGNAIASLSEVSFFDWLITILLTLAVVGLIARKLIKKGVIELKK